MDKNSSILIENIDEIPASWQEEEDKEQNKALFIVLCDRGQLQITLNEQQYMLSQGQLLLCLPTFIIGHYMRTPDCQCRVICMPEERFIRLTSGTRQTSRWCEKYTMLRRNPIISLTEEEMAIMESYAATLKAYQQSQPTPFRQQMIQWLEETMYYEMADYLNATAEETDGESVSQPDRLFRRFFQMLHSGIITEREVRWYAEQLCITPKYLTMICYQKEGKSASAIIRETLTEQIRRQLTETDIPVKELTYKFHFPSQSFFGKFVRQNLGSSPRQFRAANRIIK